jgi:hypothetical protein
MQYIAAGYQSLVTFECASGGYNWWVGDDPGNAILTAMMVMMTSDTKKVSYVDEKVIQRAAKWLADKQRSDGSWGEEMHLHSGNETLGKGSLRATAYITWALLESGYETATVKKALSHLRQEVSKEKDVYTQAMVVKALAINNASDSAINAVVKSIHDAREEDGDFIFWKPNGATMVQSWGNNAYIESTALVALAFMEAGAYPGDVQGGLNYLIANKDDQGNWGYSTQATVLALKALLGSLSASGAATTAATATVFLNGEEIATRDFTDFNADVLWQVDLSELAIEGENHVTLEYEGVGNLMYQMTSTHFVPWTEVEPEVTGPLTIDVEYDKTTLSVDDTIHVTVKVTNNDAEASGMVMADLGLPPGFEVDLSELNSLKAQGVVQKIEKTSLNLLVYINSVIPGEPLVFGYNLIAQYPLEAAAPKSEAYFYYNKEEKAEAPPVGVIVK